MIRSPKLKPCPKCGAKLRPIHDRTVRGGTWWEVWCENCGHVEDAFVPSHFNTLKDTTRND